MKKQTRNIFGTALGLSALSLVALGCASSSPDASAAGAGGMSSSSGSGPVIGGAGAGAVPGPVGGSAPATGGGSAGTPSDSGGGSSSTGGASGSAGTGGTPAGGSAGGAGLPETSSDGDGDSMIGPTYTTQKDLTDQGKPKGESFSFTMPLSASKFYDGNDPTIDPSKANANRKIDVYVPKTYMDGTVAPVLVIQDGPGELSQVSRALDNLTVSTDPLRQLPAFIAVAVQNGGSDSIGSERGLEYDTLSTKYARFIVEEILPAVAANAQVKAKFPNLKFTNDPSGRAALGCSSGGAAAFTMGWFSPNLFSRVIAYSATLVAQQNPKAPESAMYPDGAWEYHSGKKLIENDTEGRDKKLRIVINANENDLGASAAESGKHNWVMANQRTAAALKLKHFHYKYIEGLGQGHCSGSVRSATLADALVWVWRGYQPTGT